MKAARVGYVLVMTALLSSTVFLGLANYYPAPKGASYPTYPTTPIAPYDYNAPDYLEQQQKYQDNLKKYDEDMKNYDRDSKEAGKQQQVWTERISMYILIAAGALFILGVFLTAMAPLVGASFLFTAFILLVFGKGGVALYSLASSFPLYSREVLEAPDAAKEYQKLQFYVGAGISVIGMLLGFAKPLLYSDHSKKSE